MSIQDDLDHARADLAERLRRLRLESGLTGRQLADRIGVSPSKISKIEHRQLNISETDVTSIADALDVPATTREDLILAARAIATGYVDGRRRSPIGRLSPEVLIEIENEATMFRSVRWDMIPGLLQTADFARAHLRLGYPDADDAQIDYYVMLRMRRQARLFNRQYGFHFIFPERCLRSVFDPTDVMRSQLGQLLDRMCLPNVRIGIIPESAHMTVNALISFGIFDDEVVALETARSALALRAPQDVKEHLELFSRLEALAHYGESAQQLVLSQIRDGNLGETVDLTFSRT